MLLRGPRQVVSIHQRLENSNSGYPWWIKYLQDYYTPLGIKYLGLKMFDVPQTNIKKHFDTSTQFIESALNSGGKH